MDSTTQTLKNYNYKNAVLPLYDIAGSKKIETAAPDANSFKGAMTYSNMIQKKFGVGDLQHGSNNISSLIQNPLANGGDLVFTNKLPVGDLEDPTRVDNTPRTYAQTNFFTQFNALPSHMVQGKEVIIYKKNSGSC
jgi:hypothetical protein